jgi:hypothetical protein
LGSVIARAISRLQASLGEKPENGGDELAMAYILDGMLRSRSGDHHGALAAFARLEDGPGATGVSTILPQEVAGQAAGELFLSARALGDRTAALRAVQQLLSLGLTKESADAMAGLLRSWPVDAGGRSELAAALEDIIVVHGAGAAWLDEVWRSALRDASAARTSRRGYFSGELRRLEERVTEIASLLETEESVSWVLGDDRAQSLCALASNRVAELIGELVVYQPLSEEPVNPRQVALEAVISAREDVGLDRIELRTAPQGREPPAQEHPSATDTVMLDSALVKSVLRQTILRVAKVAGAQGPGAVRPALPKPALTVETRRGWPGHGGDALALVIQVSGRPAGVSRGGRRKAGDQGSLGPLLRSFLSSLQESTVPDGLARAHGEVRVAAGAGPEDWSVTLIFPADAVDGPAAAERMITERLPETIRSGLQSAGGVEAAASYVVDALGAAIDREATAWGEELAVALHDLKNSLAFVASWLGGRQLYDPGTVRQRCVESIEDVRFWLAEAGAMLARPEGTPGPYTDIAAATRRVLRGLAAAAAQKGVAVETSLPSAPMLAPVEAFRVASVVRNLAKNGLEATPSGGTLAIAVSTGKPPGTVDVTVRDQGPGFPPGVLSGGGARQIGNGLRRPRLGLLSARRILQDSGGELVLTNDAGGVATARFPAGEGTARLAQDMHRWQEVSEEARRALRAAAAMSSAGNHDMARHLWQSALEIESSALRATVKRHELLPRATELLAGQGRGQLAPGVRAALASAYGPNQLQQAEQRAKSLLTEIVRDRLRPQELDLEGLGLLLLLFESAPGQEPQRAPRGKAPAGGLPAAGSLGDAALSPGDARAARESARQVAVSLSAAVRALGDQEGDVEQTEQTVLRAVESLASFKTGRAGH